MGDAKGGRGRGGIQLTEEGAEPDGDFGWVIEAVREKNGGKH